MVKRLGLLLLAITLAVTAPGSPLVTAPSSQPPPTPLTIAAAANLTDVFTKIAGQFTTATGIPVQLTFGSTGDLANQLRNGAKFDLFAAADVSTVDALIQDGFILASSRTLYARGKLVVWWRQDSSIRITSLDDLLKPEIKHIAIADPALAPYGEAAKETLIAAGLWDVLQPKLLVAPNISATKQLVVDGKAEVGFIAISLITPGAELFFAPSNQLYRPIFQALGILTSSTNQVAARQFITFLTVGPGRAVLEDFWYIIPCDTGPPVPVTVPGQLRSGTATGVGDQNGRGAVRLLGVFTFSGPVNLAASGAKATILSALKESNGHQLVPDGQVTLAADPRNNATTARFKSASETTPITEITIGDQGRGQFNLRLA